MDEEDEGRAERLEHAEVLAVQRQQLRDLAADDFGALPGGGGASGGGASGGGESAGMVVERLERDLSALSEAEKARLLEAEAPELVSLLDDFKAIVPDVRERLEPLLLAVRQRQLPASPGVALLQLKLQLLLSYCTNIAFYLLLKASGRPVRDHPVVASLLRHRVLIDRLAPLDKASSGRDAAKLWPSSGRALAEIRMRARCGREAAGKRARCGRDLAGTWPGLAVGASRHSHNPSSAA